ncbi:hypothetical protein SUSAZ_02015 [Sulfolobus acidocaldarius SUSAZ]|nr:hypothetical protein SUSAZ_02015 [Sulfolobus acidocaldarius SUSAZ]
MLIRYDQRVIIVRRLYAFTTPKRREPIRDYELRMLRYISEKFELGDIIEYARWDDEDIRYIEAVFEGGKVKMRYKEGKEGIAEIKTRRGEPLRFR